MPTLTRMSSCLRPLRFEDREVASYNFYKNGEVVLRINQGWLERKGANYDQRDVQTILVNADIRRCTKLKLSGGHFYINSTKSSFDKKHCIDVYFELDTGDFSVSDEFDLLDYSSDHGDTFQKARKLTGCFDGNVEEITVTIPGTSFEKRSAYGEKMAAIFKHTGNAKPSVEDIIRDPVLLTLINEAANILQYERERNDILSDFSGT